MINIDVDPDPHSDPTNSPPHQDPTRYSSNNLHSTHDNDRQYQDSLYNNPPHSPLKHPFQKKSGLESSKDDEKDQDIRKGQDEGRVVPKELKTLAEQEAKVNHRHKFQMKASQRQYKALKAESEGNNDESSETEEEEEKKSSNFFQRWRKNKKEGKDKYKKKKKKSNGEKLPPIAKRILVDDCVRQKDYYGKDYQAERVVMVNKFAMAIARIAIRGKDPKACDAFKKALEKVNPEMLKTAQKEMDFKRRHKIKKVLPVLKKELKKPFDPNSFFVLMTEIVLFFTIIAETLFTTYLVTFVPEDELFPSEWPLIICYVADFLFFLRILLNFHIAVYDKGELNYNSKYIALYYFKGMLLLDAFTLCNIIGYFFLDSRWRALMALAVIRIYKIPLIIKVFENYFQVSREIGALIRVIKLGLVMYLYAHLCACLLYAVGSHEDNPPGSWITNGGFEGEIPGDLYVISVYWSAQTITTVGYGDITPVTIKERALLIFVFLCSSIILGYIIGTIASILTEMSSFTDENWEKMRLLKKYMDDKGLKKETKDRIMRYVRYYLGRENVSKIKDSDMIQLLSDNLKEDIIKEINVKILSDCHMFSHNFGRPFLLAVAKELVEKSYGPDEYVFRYQDDDTHSIYFILTGSIEVVYGKSNVRLALLEKSNFFGFMSFFGEEARVLSAQSLEFTTLFELSRELFIQKLKEFPSENETFCLIKDNLGLYKSNQNLVNVPCYLCGKLSHLALHCPIVHWYKSPLKVISKYLVEQEKFRRSFKRRDRERFSPLSKRKELEEAAEKIQNSEKYDIVQSIKGFLLIGQDDVESYSSIDEMMDRNIYDPEPLVFAGDLVQPKELEVGSKYINIFDEKEQENLQKEVFVARPKVEPGVIQTFVTRNYDAYLHNLNLDQAKSWEIYFPHNNVGVVLDALEAERLKKLAKVHHLPEALMKNLKFANDKSKSDPRTMRLAVLNSQRPLTGKKKSSQDSLQDPGQSQMYVIPARNRAFEGGVEKKEEEKQLRSFKTVQNTRRKVELKKSYSDVEDNAKENIPPLRSLNEEIRTEKGGEKEDEKLLKKDIKEESPSLAAEVEEEEIEERSEDSREYCKKVLGSDYDGLMKKFTDMLAESMKKVNDDENSK